MFKFTIRELLLSTIVVAMGLGWWIDRRELALEQAFHSSLTRVDGPVYLNPGWQGNSQLNGPVYVHLPEY